MPVPPPAFTENIGIGRVGTVGNRVHHNGLGAGLGYGFVHAQNHVRVISYDSGGFLRHVVKTAHVGRAVHNVRGLVLAQKRRGGSRVAQVEPRAEGGSHKIALLPAQLQRYVAAGKSGVAEQY